MTSTNDDDPYKDRIFFPPLPKPLQGAIIRDWTQKDFTLTLALYDEKTGKYLTYHTTSITHATRKYKEQGKKAKLGKNGHIMFCIPIQLPMLVTT